MTGDGIIERPTARLIVLDPADRILLFRAKVGHSLEPERRPDATTYWALPGGGIEPGETAEAAARRELYEETGLIADERLAMVAFRLAEYAWKGRRFRAREHIYFTRTATSDLDMSGWQERDRNWMCDMGWWTLDELAATADIVRPPRLVPMARDLARGVVPSAPIVLSADGRGDTRY